MLLEMLWNEVAKRCRKKNASWKYVKVPNLMWNCTTSRTGSNCSTWTPNTGMRKPYFFDFKICEFLENIFRLRFGRFSNFWNFKKKCEFAKIFATKRYGANVEQLHINPVPAWRLIPCRRCPASIVQFWWFLEDFWLYFRVFAWISRIFFKIFKNTCKSCTMHARSPACPGGRWIQHP